MQINVWDRIRAKAERHLAKLFFGHNKGTRDENLNNVMATLIALFLALIASLIFALPFRGKESSVVAVILIFIILSLAGLIAQYWIMPFGPLIWGVSLMIILIIALLLATPSQYQKRINGVKGGEQGEVKTGGFLSGLVWTLFFLLSATVLIGYFL